MPVGIRWGTVGTLWPRRLGIVLAGASIVALATFAAPEVVRTPRPARAPGRVSTGATEVVPPGSATTTATSGSTTRVFGVSRQGRPIEVVSFGSGPSHVLVVGGIHGNEHGTAVATELMTYVVSHPEVIPPGIMLDVVACANPDGFAARQRVNAAGVDINRNFPAKWKRNGARWGESAGTYAASEPETKALMRLLAERQYSRVVALHSAGGLVDFDGPGSRALAHRIAQSAGLPVVHLAALHHYTGSMGVYVPATYGIPTITLELKGTALTPDVLAGLLTAIGTPSR